MWPSHYADNRRGTAGRVGVLTAMDDRRLAAVEVVHALRTVQCHPQLLLVIQLDLGPVGNIGVSEATSTSSLAPLPMT